MVVWLRVNCNINLLGITLVFLVLYVFGTPALLFGLVYRAAKCILFVYIYMCVCLCVYANVYWACACAYVCSVCV